MQREKLHNPQSEAYSSCVVLVVKETQNSVRPIFAAPEKNNLYRNFIFIILFEEQPNSTKK
jgi:hypothetical protein